MVFSWRRFRERATDVLHLDEEPSRLATGMAAGVFIGVTPFYGLHTLLALAAAYVFRLNKAATITGAWLNLPWFAPFVYAFCLRLGEAVITGDWSRFSLASVLGLAESAGGVSSRPGPAETAGTLCQTICGALFLASIPLFVGTTIVGLVLAVAAYFMTLEAVRDVRRLRARCTTRPSPRRARPSGRSGRPDAEPSRSLLEELALLGARAWPWARRRATSLARVARIVLVLLVGWIAYRLLHGPDRPRAPPARRRDRLSGARVQRARTLGPLLTSIVALPGGVRGRHRRPPADRHRRPHAHRVGGGGRPGDRPRGPEPHPRRPHRVLPPLREPDRGRATSIEVGPHTGVVESVGLRVTKIRKFSGELRIVPNSELTAFGHAHRRLGAAWSSRSRSTTTRTWAAPSGCSVRSAEAWPLPTREGARAAGRRGHPPLRAGSRRSRSCASTPGSSRSRSSRSSSRRAGG